MAVLQLKGEIISYKYNNSTSAPGNNDRSSEISFSSALSSMTVGSTYS